MSIYLIGDTHSGLDEAKLYPDYFPNYNECTKGDTIIQLGDFGYIWDGSEKEALRMKSVFENKKWGDVFVVLGNHENYKLISEYPIIEKNGGKVRKISNNIYSMIRGEIYNIDGYNILAFGGATSTDRECRVLNETYWREEKFTEIEKENAYTNLEKYNFEVDLILTHTCSSSTINHLINKHLINRMELDSHNKLFEEFKEKVSYKHWIFAHLHLDLNINEKETVIFNKIVKIPAIKNASNNCLYDELRKSIIYSIDDKGISFPSYEIQNIIDIATYGVSVATYNKLHSSKNKY